LTGKKDECNLRSKYICIMMILKCKEKIEKEKEEKKTSSRRVVYCVEYIFFLPILSEAHGLLSFFFVCPSRKSSFYN
jgi:hypothetical protein